MAGHSRKKLELTGQRFGKLTVLGPAENIGSRTAWRCLCDCGQETVVPTRRLRDGRRTSCGCDRPYPEDSPGEAGRTSLTFVDGTCVEWWKRKQRWRASICFKGKRHYLGSYTRFEDAVQARKRAEEELYQPFLAEYDQAANQ